MLKLFFAFDVMYGQPNLEETFKNFGPTINALSFAVVHIFELFFIVSGAQTITSEVEKNRLHGMRRIECYEPHTSKI